MSSNKLLVFVFLLLSVACNNAPERPEPILPDGYVPSTPGTEVETPTKTTEPAQNAAGVWHYTCPSGCAGGGASATPCGTCGTTLVHNTEYHNSSGETPTGQTKTTVATSTNGQITPTNNLGVTTTTPPKTPEPAQNSAGVWHYTCPSGCAGGGGAAGPCGSCGATLAHNSDYHQ